MAHKRQLSTADTIKEPHTVTLKVLRLSKPTLTDQPTLSLLESDEELRKESGDATVLSFALIEEDESKAALSLPPGFGVAYVGETFSCTLYVNNEQESSSATLSSTVSDVSLTAEIQTPSKSVKLDLESPVEASTTESEGSIQKIVRYDLQEEGSHTIAITVSYTEGPVSLGLQPDTTKSGSRTRSFRKLYQFIAQKCLAIRTKTRKMENFSNLELAGKEEIPHLSQYVIEAQFENVGETAIVFENINMVLQRQFYCKPLEHKTTTEKPSRSKIISPGNAHQMAFQIAEASQPATDVSDTSFGSLNELGKVTIGQLRIQWRNKMGDRGFISTGWLTGPA